MTEAQRVGQLFMVGTPATTASPAALADVSRFHVGNLLLTGRSHGGAAAAYRVVRAAQARVTGASTAGVSLFVATDQEGGAVQVLNGPGIADMPAAVTQGSWPVARVRSAARVWGRQLRASGVNLDLAPVMDTVPGAAAARRNPPIGAYQREFGYTPAVVAGHGTAFAQGLADAGVASAAKHFPGLGRVTANPDTSSGVTDAVTRRGDPYLAPFRTATTTGRVPFVMMSTAYYAKLDRANPAAFSPFIIGTVLRGDLHFSGVVIADDLGNARQVAQWSAGERAVRFVAAGGDMVLTVNPAVLPAMYDAVLARATSDAHFRAKVEAATLRVLRAKEREHLLGAQR